MRSSKSRSRSKQNRQRSPMGNIVNRVFDSSGPEGKVRGTPQQIIDKYLALARDAQLGNDRVAAENFLQHAEHYARMLGEAQRELDAQRQQNGQGSGDQPRGEGDDRGARDDTRGEDNRGGDRRDDRSRDDRGRDERSGEGRSGDGRSGDGRSGDGRGGDGRGGEGRDRRREQRRDSDVIEIGDDDGSGLVETPEMRGAAPAEDDAAAPEPGGDDRGGDGQRPRRGRRPRRKDGDSTGGEGGSRSEAAE